MSNGECYFGFTDDLKNRFADHCAGKVFTTKKYLPVSLAYYEAFASEKDAREREKNLKQYGSSHSHLKKRIANSLSDVHERG